MKHLVWLICLCFFQANVINAQQVSDKQWSLIHERTADWCPNCGTWGWNLKTKLIEKFDKKNVVFMASHHSGGLSNPTSVEFGKNFEGLGQPIFYMDGTDMDANSSNGSVVLSDAELVATFNESAQPFAGVGIEATLSEATNTLSVNAKVEFLLDVEGGDYYLSLYLLEDVINKQESRTNNELHKNVLRTSLLEGAFGKPLIKGAVAKGKTFTESVTIPNITPDRSKIKVLGVIWTKVNGKYLFFNANIANVGIPASDNTVLNETQMNAFQSESGNIVMTVELTEPLNDAVVKITDISGKLIANHAVKNVQSGKHTINIDGQLNPGVHIISLIDGNKISSKKVVIQ